MTNVLPLTGTYLAQDGDDTFEIQVTSAEPQAGHISGHYQATSPDGLITAHGEIGRYFWVGSPQGGDTPFSVYFACSFRPHGWPYCVCDVWAGAYTADNAFVMAGVRSLVSTQVLDRTLKLTQFKELTFARQAG